jgi:hypothetical protein
MAKEPRNPKSLEALRRENRKSLPTFGSEIRAITREAMKDIRQTLHESYFGHGEHAPEPGSPFNPTIIEVNKERHEDIKPLPMQQGSELER